MAITVATGDANSSLVSGSYTFDLSTKTYESNVSDELVTWNSAYAVIKNERNGSGNTKVSNYLGGDSNNRTSSRMYSGNKMTITPATNVTITALTFTATSDGYATALKNSTFTNASAVANAKVVTVTPTNGAADIIIALGGTVGFTSIVIEYEAPAQA